MVKRVNRLEDLGELIRARKPAEVLYDLGEGEKRTEILLTYIDGDSIASTRIATPPVIKLYDDNGRLLMDINDSDKDADRYSYSGLTPQGAVFEQPKHPPHELGNLVVDLGGDNRKLAFSQYERRE